MSEANGNRDSRMDRIERALELLIADHEQFRLDHKQLLTAQVIQQGELENLLKVTQEHSRQIPELNKRVDDLVGAVRELISRIPPQSLR